MVATDPIQDFFHDQEVFLTGASGLIGKSVIEKLLRSCPGIKRIYLLLREKHGKSCVDRLEDLKKSQIFDRIRDEGKSEVLNKLVALNGDIGEIRFGLSDKDLNSLQNVSVIFHVAATIRFDEPLKNAIFQNVRGTREALLIAEKLKNLKKFVHCSTAYSNPYLSAVEEKLYPEYTDWENCIKMAEKYDMGTLDALGSKIMKNFPNTYTFSKHVAEHLVNSFRDRVPIAIFRPAIVLNALQEPFPGWYDSVVGFMGFFVLIGSGLLRVSAADENNIFEFAPLDMTAAFLIMTAWKDFTLPPLKPNEDVRVYHLCSRKYISNSIKEHTEKFFKIHLQNYPFEKTLWHPKVTFTKTFFMLNIFLFHLIPALFIETLVMLTGNKPFMLKILRKVIAAHTTLHFFENRAYNFSNERMHSLLLESKDFVEFKYDHTMEFSSDEIMKRCVIGTRKYVLKNSDESLKSSIIRFQILKWLDRSIDLYLYYWLASKSFSILLNYLPTESLTF